MDDAVGKVVEEVQGAVVAELGAIGRPDVGRGRGNLRRGRRMRRWQGFDRRGFLKLMGASLALAGGRGEGRGAASRSRWRRLFRM